MKKITIFLCTILFAFLVGQRAELDFNQDWKFLPTDLKKSEPESWISVPLPHTWNLDAYREKNYKRDTFYYKKAFSIPENLSDKKLYLRFNAVNSYAEVFLNDEKIAQHSGGYSAFQVLLPQELLKKNDNLLLVKVDNRNHEIPPLSGDFTIFGGIYRDVKLIALEREHFDMDNFGSKGVFISSPNIDHNRASLWINGNVKNPEKENIQIEVNIEYLGKNILSKTKTFTDESFEISDLKITQPKLWSPENPNLYQIRLSLKKQGKTKDEITIPYGLRWFSADTENGFLLNGKPLKLIGTNRHQDQFPYGIAVPKSVHWNDIRLIKETGANFLRLAHYQQDDEVLKACDSLGLIVWEEIPVVDIISDSEKFKQNAESQLKEMVRQHYNHPSVIFWGYMNEPVIQVQYRIPEEQKSTFYQKTVELAKHLEHLLKTEDSTRLSAIAFHGTNLYNEIGMNGIADVTGWNLYQGWYGDRLEDFENFMDEQHKKYPKQPIIISEFGAGSDKRLHSLHPETFDFSMEYQQKFLEHYLPQIEKRKFVIGATEWNFIDFNVASRQESMPRTNNKGLVYNNRHTKDVYYYFKSYLTKNTPVLHIATDDWNRRTAISDDESYTYPIKVYSNLPKIRLKINGTEKEFKSTENYFAVWNIPLREGKNTILTFDETGKITHQKDVLLSLIPEHFSKTHKNIDVAINAGSNCDFWDEKNQIFWLADHPYSKGSWGYIDGKVFRKSPDRIGTTAEISNTENTPLFQTKRENITEYRFDLPKGKYRITLGFSDLYNSPKAEAYDLSKKQKNNVAINIFDVEINGKQILKNFSPYQLSGNNSAIIQTFEIGTTTSEIKISFIPKSGKPFVNAIRITSESN